MRTTSLTMVLLVAAALAGCTGGSDQAKMPTGDLEEDGTSSSSSTRSSTRGPSDQGGQGRDQAYVGHLEAVPDNGTAPLDVTLEFDVTWCDRGRHLGQGDDDAAGSGDQTSGGNGTSGGTQTNSTSTATQTSTGFSNGTTGGNGTGGNKTADEEDACKHPLNPSHGDVAWTLKVLVNATAGNGTDGNGTDGNGTAGNGTASSTTGPSSSSTTTTASTGTTTGSSGNGTGNSTGNGTGNATGNGTGGARVHGTVVASFNGTADDLPGNRTVTLNEGGSYDAVFTVSSGNGTNGTTEDVVQVTITVTDLPAGTPLGNETRTFEGSFLASEPFLCFGSEDFEWVLNGTFGGRAAEVSHVNVTVEASGFADVELTFAAPNGTEIQSGAELNATGPFAPGNYTLTAESCVAAEAEYAITAVAHYVSLGREDA